MLRVHIRWLVIANDLPEVVEIERSCFEFPWEARDFRYALSGDKNTIGMVALCGNEIIGYIVYRIEGQRLSIQNMAVRYEYRRHGVGRQIVGRLMDRLTRGRRDCIVADIRENNLGAQLFFKSLGFYCTKILHNWYVDCEGDAYRFEFRLPREAA